MVPCTLDAEGTTFGFTVDGQKMSVKVPAATLSALTAGKIHKLKFIIHAASITLSDVSIIDWTSAWSAGSEPNIDGTPKDYIELDGVKWAISTWNITPRTARMALPPPSPPMAHTLNGMR
ncbi:fimbrillin family protein [Bacteroides sp. CR5/BHMF/2]|nr:fimbrillin family protein [Bacteroides sp. CR5/BHMF/2]